jgi:hypothetical protein
LLDLDDVDLDRLDQGDETDALHRCKLGRFLRVVDPFFLVPGENEHAAGRGQQHRDKGEIRECDPKVYRHEKKYPANGAGRWCSRTIRGFGTLGALLNASGRLGLCPDFR